MNTSLALIVGAVLIAFSIAISHRFETTATGGNVPVVLVTDHWTGNVKYCDPNPANGGENGSNFWCYKLADPLR
jgi:hypothetical protein